MNDKERLAAEAKRLLSEPLFVDALDSIMADAFAEFKELKLGPDTLHEAIALQQRIIAVHAITDYIDARITASGQRDGGVSMETDRPH